MITDYTPRWEFYLVQDPRILLLLSLQRRP